MNIRFHGTIALAGIVAASLLLTGCGKKEMISVNGEKVSRDEFYSKLEQVVVQTPSGPKRAGEYVVKQLIDEKLILQYAKSKGVAPTPEQVDQRIERLRKQGANIQSMLKQNGMTMEDLKRKQAVEQAFVNVITKNITVPDSDVQKAYNAALKDPKSGLKTPERARISVITCSKAKLATIQSRLNSGEQFNAVARELSDDPTGKASDGQLGVWLVRGMPRVPAIVLNYAFTTGVGKYSNPFVVGGKYTFIKVDQRTPAKITSYDEIKDVIKERIALNLGMKRGDFKDDMKKFVQSAKIDITTSTYKGIVDEIRKTAGTPEGNASSVAPK